MKGKKYLSVFLIYQISHVFDISNFTRGFEALRIIGILFCLEMSLDNCETKETELRREI